MRLMLRAWLVALLLAPPLAPQSPSLPAGQAAARDIYKQLIEINTVDKTGNVTTAAEAMRQRFRAAGFPDADVFRSEEHTSELQSH